jgi:hypothetical protein
MEIRALQACPICESKTSRLHRQNQSGFRVECSTCQSSRYLKVVGDRRIYEIHLADSCVENNFSARGRWFSVGT